MSDENHCGVACPRCGCKHLKGRDMKRSKSANFRYRYCRHCGQLVRTKEVIVQVVDKFVDPETGKSLPADDISDETDENSTDDIPTLLPLSKMRA